MHLVDTHAHIHFPDYGLDPDKVLENAQKVGINKVVVVGCDIETSRLGLAFAKTHRNVWSAVGVHPHYAKNFKDVDVKTLEDLVEKDRKSERKIVAIGECGLDYHYENSPKNQQKTMLEKHLGLAAKYDLPVIFHVRDAYEDFWPIYDKYPGVKGVMHSFSATTKELNEALKRGLYIGLNGIMTFTKDADQLEAAKKVPKDRLVLETDAPYLTPSPFRGSICSPEHVKLTAEFLANLRAEQMEELAQYTTFNAGQLFSL